MVWLVGESRKEGGGTKLMETPVHVGSGFPAKNGTVDRKPWCTD